MTNKRESKRDAGLEWQVLGDAGAPLPTEPEPDERVRRPWLPWLLVFLGALALGAGASGATLVWRAQQQQERLRADLLAVVEAETQAQAFGLTEQIGQLVDPRAPEAWRLRYATLFEPREWGGRAMWLVPNTLVRWRPPAVRPTVRGVTLNTEGSRAVIEVVWQDRAEVVEQRAYRLVRGSWRRTPLRDESVVGPPWHQTHTPHFHLRAHPSEFGQGGDEAALLLALEGLRDHMATSWPAPLGDTMPPTLTLTLEPQEFEPVVINVREDELIINPMDLTPFHAALPLSMASQRRIGIANQVNLLLVQSLEPQISGLTPNEFQPYLYLFFFLPESDTALWLLEDGERRALRNAWREELKGAWQSPIGPFDPELDENDPASVDNLLTWIISTRLFVEQLREQGYMDTPGDLAHTFLERPDRSFEATLLALTGLDRATLETLARDYALTAEPETADEVMR